ncbi:FliM/FliN family flagellar motor switch protein [Pandoraea pnomenusa]|uniref:FliM/FliN family flagellar motor switch protein n=1 Tax=Pandoraea pnomenusa TaxID=93220 RepID=UPI00333E5353
MSDTSPFPPFSADHPSDSDGKTPGAIDPLADDALLPLDGLSGDLSDDLGTDWQDNADAIGSGSAAGGERAAAPLAMRETLRRVPVKLTLEVGAARLTLGELSALRTDDVLSLDRAAGAPLSVLVNGVPVGLAEVVVSGTQYGLKILTLDAIELDRLAQ